MRIFLHILLGALALGALVHGVRKLLRAKDPDSEGIAEAANDFDGQQKSLGEDFTDWANSRNGRVTIIVLSVLFLFMAIDRFIGVGNKMPANYTPVPTQEYGAIVKQ